MNGNHEQLDGDASPVVISSGEEENTQSPLHPALQNQYSENVISIDDDSSDDDCEILSVEDQQGEGKWRDVKGPFKRLNALLRAGYNDPRQLLMHVFGIEEKSLPSDPNHMLNLLLTLLAEPTPRRCLRHINSLDNVLHLLSTCSSILVITGAGVSVSCGIPDFRSRDGIYARLSKDYPDLSSPQAMFDMAYFTQNPVPFFKFAKGFDSITVVTNIYHDNCSENQSGTKDVKHNYIKIDELFPGQFTPSITHNLIALLESKNKLLRNYTQNIDTLEQAAGITRLIQCHGSFASASCTSCGHKVPGSEIKDAVFAQSIPLCPLCWPKKSSNQTEGLTESQCLMTTVQSPGSSLPSNGHTNKKLSISENSLANPKDSPSFGVLKPDIVFFGEGLSNEFHDTLSEDIKKTDLVLVMGSSLKVRPVAHIPNAIPEQIPQILINREPLTNHDFDVELLGDCDLIVSELCSRLGWEPAGFKSHPIFKEVPLKELFDKVMKVSQTDIKSSSQSSTTSKDAHIVESTNNATSLVTESDKELVNSERSLSQTVDSSESKEVPTEVPTQELSEEQTIIEVSEDENEDEEEDDDDEDDVWEVAAYLPPSSFTRIPPNQYVFPGAEYYLNKNADLDSFEQSDESESSSPSKSEHRTPNHEASSSHSPNPSTPAPTNPDNDQDPGTLHSSLKRPSQDSVSPIENSPKQARVSQQED